MTLLWASKPDSRPPHVKIVKGPHAGREGRDVTMFGWLGLRKLINVPANEKEIRDRFTAGWGEDVQELVDNMKEGNGPRHCVGVWRWQVERH